ncbi:uncharacterized protein LOC128964753 [Oppia nitens]|uniref:uncharacterized protein LOC128964753 n=1 Tax=Oppia nitens TaxID=1686743 RepID=UPI0023DB9894|nr:uncharacterized protein LOC128964753 [Oppia nitens]
MVTTKDKVPFVIIFIIVCANYAISAHFQQNTNKDLFKQIISRKMDVDRQGLIGSSLLGGPLAVAAFLLTLPALPALLMAPLAVAGLRPTIGAVGQFMNSINSGSGFTQGIASLLNPPNSLDQDTSASNSVSSTSTTGSNNAAVSSFSSALRSISELIFNRRLSNPGLNRIPNKQQNPNSETTNTKPNSDSTESPQQRIGTLMSSLRDVYGIIKNGLRRYEITDSDCQSRIICEVHQKAVGRSTPLATFTAQLMDIIGLEKHLEGSNAVTEKSKYFIKDFVRAAKTGLKNKDCSSVFSRCPAISNILDSPHFSAINNLKDRPNIQEINQLLQSKLSPNKAIGKQVIKASLLKTPQTLIYNTNIKQKL